MKNRCYIGRLLAVAFLVGLIDMLGVPLIKEAITAEPATLTVYNPAGAREITVLHAKRLDTLAGKTICELTNTGWQAHRTFPLVRELLKKPISYNKRLSPTTSSPKELA